MIGEQKLLVDFHSHILPGIDDGSKDAEMSRRMLELESAGGVNKIVLTPHFYLSKQSLGSFLEKRSRAAEQLEPIADELGIKVKYGAEVLYTKSLIDADLTKLCISGTRYMMVELPYQRLSGEFINEFRSFAGSIFPDIIPILAHAERYLHFTSEESILEIMESDMLVQLNSGDFKMFSKSLKFMLRLIDQGLAHLLGTDCHNITTRPPDMDIARKTISRKRSPECFRRLMDNAERVFSGETI